MTGQAILDALKPYLDGGKLSIPKANSLKSPNLATLIDTMFGGTLTATDATPTTNTDTVVFTNATLDTSAFIFYAKDPTIPATLTFAAGQEGDAIALAIAIALPSGYALTDSFPAVKTKGPAPLANLALSTATLGIDSAKSTDTADFSADIDNANSVTAGMVWALGDKTTVSGDLAVLSADGDKPFPRLNLNSAAAKSPALSGFELDLVLGFYSTVNTQQDKGLQQACVTASLVTPGLTVPISVSITGKDQTTFPITLDPRTKTPALSGLDALSGFSAGQKPTGLISADTPLGALSLDNVSLSLDAQQKRLSDLQVIVSLNSQWKIIPDVFELDNLRFTFMAPNLFGTGTPDKSAALVYATVLAELKIGSTLIDATITYPDETVSVTLAQGATIDIGDMLGTLAKGVNLPGSYDLKIVVFNANADIKNKSFSLECMAAGSLSVIPKFVLEDITLSTAYSDGAVQSFDFLSHFAIAGADLFVQADWAKDGGWTLSGGTTQDGSIDIGALVKDLLDIFDVDIPTGFPDIKLSTLALNNYKTKDGSFAFAAEVDYIAGDDAILKKITGKVDIAYSGTPDKTWQGSLKGFLEIGNNQVTAEYDFKDQKVFALSWNATGKETIGIADFCNLLGITPPDIPTDLDLALVSLTGKYDFTDHMVVLEAKSKNYGQAVLVALKPDAKWQLFFGLATDKTIDLTDIPLLGKPLSEITTVSLQDISAEVSTAPIDKELAKTIAGQIDKGYPTPPTDGMGKGVALGMTLDAGGNPVPLQLTLGGGDSSENLTAIAAPDGMHPAALPATLNGAAAPGDSDSTLWFNLEKSFGAVSIQKIGLRYEDSRLWALMNASLTAGPVTISTFGLGVGSPLSDFSPKFTISGADVTVAAGPVVASGGLVGSIDPVDLYGELMLEVEPYSAGALGGFAIVDGEPSFFLYATISGDFGGPPYFFISGFAAGMGLNRALVVPPVSGVADFPLVQWAMGDQTPSSIPGDNVGDQIAQTLGALSTSGVIAPSVGEYWLAAGIKFSSFEVVNSFALITVSMGTEFEFDLLGLSTLQLPPEDPAPIVNIELQLKATVNPAAGFFSIEGQVTNNSYVISPDAHVTGGFAFYLWFAGDNEGQFLVTVGGYCDKYQVPAYYPSVPRVGLNWQITSDLSITGQQYFAVTSAAVMAGCAISAVWSSGPIRAWFNVQADFLMIYKPFHYYLSASCQLGCSVRISLIFTHVTLSFHLGVGIEIWGPDFSGKAHIDLSVISFTISFGASGQHTDTTIGWSRFVKEMLPGGSKTTQATLTALAETDLEEEAEEEAPSSVIQIQVSKGVQKTLSKKPGELNYIVDGQTFEMLVTSSVPAKDHTFTGSIKLAPDAQQPSRDGKPIKPNTDFGIGPAGVDAADFSSSIGLTMTETEGVDFKAVRILKNVPTAFWQKRDFTDKGVPQIDPANDTNIPDALVGWRLIPTAPPPDHTLPIKKTYLDHTIYGTQDDAWSAPTLPAAKSFQGQTVTDTIDGTLAKANRPALLAAMNRTGLVNVVQDVDVAGLASEATNYLTLEPELRLLGGTS